MALCFSVSSREGEDKKVNTIGDSICRRPEDVAPKFQPIFEQLHKEFPAPYETWNRAVDFGRTIIAAVLNPSKGVAVTKKGLTARVL
jgi:hypothetical protein